jgi:hypothetical protein
VHTQAVEPSEPKGALGWVLVFEARDAPPGWFDVPDLDLQPALIKAVDAAAMRAAAALLPGPAAGPDPALLVERMLTEANRAIFELSTGDRGMLYKGSFAEAVGAVLTPTEVAIGWVGAARAYLLRGGAPRCLTRDHTLLRELTESRAAEGKPLTEQEIAEFPHKNIVTRSLGLCEQVQIETRRLSLEPGDQLLLASAAVGEPPEAIVRELAARLPHEPAQPPHELAVKVATHAALAAPGRAIAAAVVKLARGES